ncbi:MAG: 4-hydroxybenzoate octaprenyltransferase [Chitinophagaceae bacterium]|nr:MAG: 4-hydroxybenzoate octaprenyltransferase [Chitinophagaceae bacterium]
MQTVKNYLSLVKFSHTIFAMPFAMIGFVLALRYYPFNSGTADPVSGIPGLVNGTDGPGSGYIIVKLLLVIGCMIFARSAAMAFNRYLDAHFDALNPRTAIREIPAGIISHSSALRFVIFNCVAFVICTWFINKICFFLSPVALFVILFYSYTKRFTPLCHLVLGLGLSLAPIGAYLAVTGAFSLLPVLFSLTVLFWVSGFDIIYALQDVDFDRSQQLYSIPAYFGKKRGLRISELLHLFSIVTVVFAGIHAGFGAWYWVGVAVFVSMLVYQHSIVKPDDLRKVNLAFMTANGIASVVFAVFVILDLILHQA